MAKKIQILVRVSECSSQEDYIVPADMKISDVIALIARIVFPAEHPAFSRVEKFTLFDHDRQAVCLPDHTAEECGLTRGSLLLLV
jgi:hypothetical protein